MCYWLTLSLPSSMSPLSFLLAINAKANPTTATTRAAIWNILWNWVNWVINEVDIIRCNQEWYERLTRNHSPLGRACFIQAAKNIAVKASRGHAINMRMPWACSTRCSKVSMPISPSSLTGLILPSLIRGIRFSWSGKRPKPVVAYNMEPLPGTGGYWLMVEILVDVPHTWISTYMDAGDTVQCGKGHTSSIFSQSKQEVIVHIQIFVLIRITTSRNGPAETVEKWRRERWWGGHNTTRSLTCTRSSHPQQIWNAQQYPLRERERK